MRTLGTQLGLVGLAAFSMLAAGCELIVDFDRDRIGEVDGGTDAGMVGEEDGGTIDTDAGTDGGPEDAGATDGAVMDGAVTDGGAVTDAAMTDGGAACAEDCAAMGDECNDGVCNESTGACELMPKTGETCTDDGLTCTNDVCDSAGECTHPVADGNCLVGDTCYADGADDPANECQACDAATSQTSFTAKTGMPTCTDDGVDCTDDVCVSGTCEHPIQDGNCLIDGTCYADGADDPSNECVECNSGMSQTAFSNDDDTSCSDGNDCTSESCAGGTCTMDSVDTGCFIDGMCVAADALNPANDCQACDPAMNTMDWTNLDGTTCDGGMCSAGTCS